MRMTVGEIVGGMSTRSRAPWSLSKSPSLAEEARSRRSPSLRRRRPCAASRRALGIVEVEDGRLRDGIGRAEARLLRLVAFDLGRTALVRLDEEAERVAAALDDRRVVRRDARNHVFRHLRIRDDLLDRAAATLGADERHGGRHRAEQTAPADEERLFGGRGREVSLRELGGVHAAAGARFGRFLLQATALFEAAPVLRGPRARAPEPDRGLACSSVAPRAVFRRVQAYEAARRGHRGRTPCSSSGSPDE